ncbi:MAG: RluA family pseudouridine synthase [Desulfuromonadales bacterium]|nr:RluA family pseudouridine synthase [Desulfuromonadales bacterium]
MNIPTDRPSRGVFRFTVPAERQGERLDQFLAGHHAGLSRGLARCLIDLGGVHLDGRRISRCSLLVAAGQQIELYIDGLPLTPFELREEHILWRDRHLLAIAKPAGVATQPTPARYRGTIYDALRRLLLAGQSGGRQPSIGMVQRLDRDTSGVMVFSIHPAAHKGLSRLFHERLVDKTYLALVGGELTEDSGQFRSLLARRRSTNRTVSVARGGRYAETGFRVRQRLAGATLVEVRLTTGRTHQIRAHFAEAGHPLLGDRDYGGLSELAGVTLPRQMLHSSRLALIHPVTGQPLGLSAPLAADFRAVLQQLGVPGQAVEPYVTGE